ncbi:MAG TPA: Ig-like domain-containing protein [Acidimicrobiia bacterium]|jgi:hypothetical protein|nr:Ig-like domain-containing protein [Acidimicrobiia bacterium]
MLRIRRRTVAVGAGAILAILVIVTWPAAGATTNTAQLDDGQCVRNLQLGTDVNASSSATPSFALVGDGGSSSYAMSIDGVSIGTFDSDIHGKVCITTSRALTQGSHQLTGRELKPNAANNVTPYGFTVDTIAPSSPSKPALDSSSDTPPQGDNVTTATSLRLIGTADARAPIRVMESDKVRAGAVADSTGHWLATTTSLPAGAHTFFAVSVDSAGNQSLPSPSVTITIGTTAPSSTTTTTARTTTTRPPTSTTTTTLPKSTTTTTTAPKPTTTTTAPKPTTTTTTTTPRTAPGAPNNVAVQFAHKSGLTLTWTPPANNGGAPITYYAVYRSTASGAEAGYALLGPTTSYSDPSTSRHTTYYYRVAAGNDVGTGAMSAEVSIALR